MLLLGALIVYRSESLSQPTSKARLRGIDLSRYQGDVDWKEVQVNGVRFVYIKASEGTREVDPRFEENITGSKEVGIPLGAYHFFEPKEDPLSQARHFLQTYKLRPGDLPPVLDVEVTQGVSTKRLVAGVRAWLEEVEQRTGCRPMLYTDFWFGQEYLEGAFGKYPLWVAAYEPVPRIPEGWSHWTFWQFSSRGRLAGVDGRVDQSYFPGNEEDLKKFACRDKTER
jgi:lysozyme